jgi:aspartyl-tRNA(Asn)/glutamyl-tRNA(Gln) amidotransferase subunit C
MSDVVSEATVRHIAHLSRLQLTDDEVRLFAGQLGAIIAYVRQLDQIDTTEVEPTAHALPITNVFRADEPGMPLTVEQALANAPRREDGFFVVPKVLGDEGGA